VLDVVDAVSAAAALAAVAAREPEIIVDLAGVEFMASSGVAALGAWAEARPARGGDLLLAAPQQQVLQVLAITRLIDVSLFMPAWTRRPAAPGAAGGSRARGRRHPAHGTGAAIYRRHDMPPAGRPWCWSRRRCRS
jgi:anti-anti-sigma factor